MEESPIYDVHPAVRHMQAIVANLPSRTGRSLEEWARLAQEEGPAGEASRREWLRQTHGLGGPTAWIIAERAEGKESHDTDPELYLKDATVFVEAMYAGPKAALRPLHDALIALGRSLGPDVKVCPCKTIVPLYREHVFAQIKPTTRTRIDFGLALKGAEKRLPSRLIDTGGMAKGDRITHRIPIERVEEIDDELREWLRTAYELDR
jgi:hypothetical protein